MIKIRGVIFDMGRVLIGLDFSRGLPAWLREHVAAELGTLVANPFFVDFNAGRLSPEDFYNRARALFQLPFTYAEFCRLWCDIFLPLPEMESLVAAVAARYPVNLLSDTDPLHWAFISENFPWIPKQFPSPTLSFRLGSNKPAMENFRAAAATLDLEPEECLFIDDLPINIEGALKVGMTGILFQNPQQLNDELLRLQILP